MSPIQECPSSFFKPMSFDEKNLFLETKPIPQISLPPSIYYLRKTLKKNLGSLNEKFKKAKVA